MNLPERLMKLRKASNLSQEEVAEKLEVTRQTVSKWETGQSSPDLDKVLPLCSLYGVTPDELLHDGGTEEADEVRAQNEAQRATELADKIMAKRRLVGILGGVMLYFVAIAFIMVAIPVLYINPIVASAIFILILAAATILIIYSAIINKSKKVAKATTKKDKKLGHIETIIALTILVVYLTSSFLTGAWHISWVLWILYPIAKEIAVLILEMNENKVEEK
jgi:transcriptional regulator with XRE-family HTH domain